MHVDSIAYCGSALFLFGGESVIEGYTTIKNIAEQWGMTPRWIQTLCSNGKIPGAVKFGRDWAIPKDAMKPTDGRVTTGEYKNWRNKMEK
ncbi:hypothetical protein CLOBOL_04794 [Enterocloster bolteae ATCC BAA-613]|uniref:DNA-binding protein n=2 Tax=Enterocloster bolteae TaxID=208479 RepID=A8RX51_ENTBW|nr:hypothetical protein CLOBOL_04794 [Enterocloster bolteae ATCC BAA-613]